MPKIIEQWLLFKYVDGQFAPLSKPFETKAAAERALGVLKYGQTAVRPDLRTDWEMLISLSFGSGVARITAKNFIPNRKNRTRAKFQPGS